MLVLQDIGKQPAWICGPRIMPVSVLLWHGQGAVFPWAVVRFRVCRAPPGHYNHRVGFISHPPDEFRGTDRDAPVTGPKRSWSKPASYQVLSSTCVLDDDLASAKAESGPNVTHTTNPCNMNVL